MYKKMALLLALFAVMALVACGGGPGGGPGEDESAGGDGELAEQLSVYNWADYIDEQILADYEEEFGVEIIYDTYASNEDLLAKLEAGAEGYDVIFPSDYMVAIMIDLGCWPRSTWMILPTLTTWTRNSWMPRLTRAISIAFRISGAQPALAIGLAMNILRRTRRPAGR